MSRTPPEVRSPRVCIAGKGEVCVHALELALQHVPPAELAILPVERDAGTAGDARSLRSAAARRNVRETTLRDVATLPDIVLISVQFDRLIPVGHFASPRLFNLHYSLLPAYRGMYPVVWPLLQGATATGVTLHWIDHGIDTGDIVAQTRLEIAPTDTAAHLYGRCAVAARALLDTHVPILITGEPARHAQPPLGASYFSRTSIDFGNFRIDLNKTACEVHNQIRALVFPEYQLPALFGVSVRGSEILPVRSTQAAGTLIHQDAQSMVVATIDFDVRVHTA
jgi:methionyl-tRNA formyltransferase